MAEIKISELSVGDWVKTVDCDARQKCCVVEGIEKWRPDYVVILKYEDGGIDTLGRKCIEPIPLTPEILEKNGFRKLDRFNEYVIGEWERNPFIAVRLAEKFVEPTILVKNGGTSTHLFGSRGEKVHQLQNALRLAGVEKGIEL